MHASVILLLCQGNPEASLMRSRALACTAAFLLTFGSFANGQYLNLPQYDNQVRLSFFLQADVNVDGKDDIVGMTGSNVITVLLGNGTGGFDAPVNTTITGVDSPSPVCTR
jgi:hypothetical protein